MDNKKEILCFSGGKDSSVLLIKLVKELNWKGKVIFADTTLELPEMYKWVNWLEKDLNIKIEKVKPKYTFDEWFFGPFTKGVKKGEQRGFPLSFGNGCHLRGTFKINNINRKINQYKKLKSKNYNILLGFAFDELKRSKQKEYLNNNYKFPLIEWKMTENDCIKFLKQNNYPFPFFNAKRTGCWLCPQQSNESLYYLFCNYPKLWEKLKWYESKDPKGEFKIGIKLQNIEIFFKYIYPKKFNSKNYTYFKKTKHIQKTFF